MEAQQREAVAQGQSRLRLRYQFFQSKRNNINDYYYNP
jgi:hypothetical protein